MSRIVTFKDWIIIRKKIKKLNFTNYEKTILLASLSFISVSIYNLAVHKNQFEILAIAIVVTSIAVIIITNVMFQNIRYYVDIDDECLQVDSAIKEYFISDQEKLQNLLNSVFLPPLQTSQVQKALNFTV